MLIGQKIKEIRIEKGVSRPDFCGDEQGTDSSSTVAN
ncbi:transposase-like protein%2C IS1515 [Streptococcus pneumoniae]|uniref:Transposase-like protein, IS1515 n=1 Tax=Streptococcus pneumoniae TaxID=1313 RepID=A0A0T8WM17_STREE|nr:transposase-like protein%2C IS1515 [Streptococcus pneumoniae]CEO77710.1 transposase-like protein%2C IS1515 [Streptococcus pneumoniae]CEV70304.1 transposase-like protein%2C IS1515 [Streptococcus pneumoniae]CEV86178.1 transposase-like protein%2C IS1515 [Streptococcus pneumoniae]CEW02716.1 transposase-like protein%2C IS1515 [Streptococcus pneumoniae]